MVTVHITRQEAQTINANSLEVIVITQLPRAFLRCREVVDLHIVDQIRIAAIEVRHRVVAVHALPTGAERVAAVRIRQHAAQRPVIDGTGLGITAVGTFQHPQIRFKHAAA
ncbi:hypothetical protein D3C81_1090790 [compost metagenome]